MARGRLPEAPGLARQGRPHLGGAEERGPLDWKPLRTRVRRLISPVPRWYEWRARRPERIRTTEAAAKAEESQGSRTLDLVGLSDRPETVAAVGSIEAVLERVFQTLGPPPEGLSHDKEPVVHGGGGNAQ